MLPHNELVIRIRSNSEICMEEVKDGVTVHKKISPNVFANCVKSSITESFVSSGILPKGCFYYAEKKGRTRICAEWDMDRYDIVYFDTLYKDFPLPRLVFGFEIEDERIRSVNLGVVAKGLLTPKSKMYFYPFSNVQEFRLCTGDNVIPKITMPHQLCGIMHHIMSMPNNTDYYYRENTRLNMELRELLETVKDKPPEFYYTDVLKDMGKTLADFVKG